MASSLSFFFVKWGGGRSVHRRDKLVENNKKELKQIEVDGVKPSQCCFKKLFV